MKEKVKEGSNKGENEKVKEIMRGENEGESERRK
jgi:hypothetical protein